MAILGGTGGGALVAGQILGTATNDNAAAGYVGEIISSTVLVGSAVSMSSGVIANVTSISLTAGDWDVWGNVAFSANAATTITNILAWINNVSVTLPTYPNGGGVTLLTCPFSTGGQNIISAGFMRFSLASTTTIYMSAYTQFAVNVMSTYGYLAGRRVR